MTDEERDEYLSGFGELLRVGKVRRFALSLALEGISFAPFVIGFTITGSWQFFLFVFGLITAVVVLLTLNLVVFTPFWILEMNLREVKKVLAERDGYFVESDISNIENDLSKAAETKDFEIVRGDNRMFFYNSEENYFAVYWSEITGGTAFIVADVEYDVLFAELLS